MNSEGQGCSSVQAEVWSREVCGARRNAGNVLVGCREGVTVTEERRIKRFGQ